MTEFYTYRISWSTLGMSYYGVRYKKNGTIADLMTKYFTSSKSVKEFIALNGMPDIVEVRKTFSDALSAKRWEERVISKGKLYSSPNWLNVGNNGSFKGIVMSDEIIRRIKVSLAAKPKIKSKIYNNGVDQVRVFEGGTVPEGYVPGVVMTEKRIAHTERLKTLKTPEERAEEGLRRRGKYKGIPKPEGFGEMISKIHKGKPKEYMKGEKNVSKRPEVRQKISDSWKNRAPLAKVYDPITNEKKTIKKAEVDHYISLGWVRGVPKGISAWYNDGTTNFFISKTDPRVESLLPGKIAKCKFMWATDGQTNIRLVLGDTIPDGFKQGRTQKINTKGTYRYVNNGVINLIIPLCDAVPEGFVMGKKNDEF